MILACSCAYQLGSEVENLSLRPKKGTKLRTIQFNSIHIKLNCEKTPDNKFCYQVFWVFFIFLFSQEIRNLNI